MIAFHQQLQHSSYPGDHSAPQTGAASAASLPANLQGVQPVVVAATVALAASAAPVQSTPTLSMLREKLLTLPPITIGAAEEKDLSAQVKKVYGELLAVFDREAPYHKLPSIREGLQAYCAVWIASNLDPEDWKVKMVHVAAISNFVSAIRGGALLETMEILEILFEQSQGTSKIAREILRDFAFGETPAEINSAARSVLTKLSQHNNPKIAEAARDLCAPELAAPLGFEPRKAVPKTAVLPLHHRAIQQLQNKLPLT